MPSTPAGIIVDPNGQTITVNITAASGAAVAVYTSKDGSTVRNLPSSHTGDPVEFWLVQPDRYTVSVLVNGTENANGIGGTRTVDLRGGGVLGMQAGSGDGDVDDEGDRSGFLTRTIANSTYAVGRVGPVDPEPDLSPGTEYVWFQTDGDGNLIDILSGVSA